MPAADAPGVRRYLHAAAFWLALAVISSFVTLQVLTGKALANGQTLLAVSLPCVAVALLGMATLWLALAKGGIRNRGALLAIGGLAGFALSTGLAFAVSDLLREPRLWLIVLVPGNLVAGVIAGTYLARQAPRDPDFWPSQHSW